ncbi:O-antigen ligase family protein [Rhodopila sp.]|uniref:O-antigen ligase family protein n=1 Tax=Rhodopila sp. TaxID=2480087 RepID=UPI003D0D5F7D
MNGNVLLAIALILTTASQFRVGGLPFGPGELCLVVWLGLRAPELFRQPSPPLTPAFCRMGTFWLLLTISLAIGTLVGLATGEIYDPNWFMHDCLAYPLLAAVSCVMVSGPEAARRLQSVARAMIALGVPSLALLLAQAAGILSIPSIEPWFWERFRGWSDNPNQLAVLCLSLAVVALHGIETARRAGQWWSAMLCLVLAVWVGRLSQSDGCTFAMLAAGLVFAAMKMRAWLVMRGPRLMLRSATAWIIIVAIPFAAAAMAPIVLSKPDSVGFLVSGLEKDGGKYADSEAKLRLALWRQALERSVRSGMLGLGPGPHLQMPAEIAADHTSGINQRGEMQSPQQGAAANYEAHNTPLDLLTQGGLILVISFFWLFGRALTGVYRFRYAGLTAMLCGLVLFGMTGLIIRQPLVWFAIALCMVKVDEAEQDACSVNRSTLVARPPGRARAERHA